METIKKNRLLAFCIANVIVFNILFFTKDFLTITALRILDVYSKCPEETLHCDVGSYTVADDIILGLFAVSLFASAISAAILLNNQIEKLWQKRLRQEQRPRPRRRL